MTTATTIKWIDLRDRIDKARLKIGTTTNGDGQQRRILFIVGLDNQSARWANAIEKLGFIASPRGKYLVRQTREGEKLQAKAFHSVWPNATLAEMTPEEVHLDLGATRRVRETAVPRSVEESSAAQETGVVVRLGRNAEGDEVYEAAAGRFIQRPGKGRVFESDLVRPEMFLRAPDAPALDRCADGFVQAMLLGEVQRSDDLDRFVGAVLGRAAPFEAATHDQMAVVIDAALVRFLNGAYETAQDAFGDAGRLYDYLPPYKGSRRGAAAMPLPLAVVAQRLLGDTKGRRVLVPNAWDGASFAFLTRGTDIRAYRGARDLSRFVAGVRQEDVTWGNAFDAQADQGADALFFNADPVTDAGGAREDYRDALVSLKALAQGARAVLVLAGDDPRRPGEISNESRRFMEALGRRFDLESAVEIGAEMTRPLGTARSLRLISLRNRPAMAASLRIDKFAVVHSWDELKSAVDEAIVKLELREAEAQSIDVDQVARENEFQRPYLAFSKVGEARTMVPKNLQAPVQYAMSILETGQGPVDTFVETELGFGPNTLGDRFSPEQVDAIGLGIGRIKSGRGIIIGDETGIGKGRILSGMATWAQKQGRNVIFVTDRANLFSDLVRDLRDIGEWGRFRPFIMNSDGVLMDVFTNEVIQKGVPAKVMEDVLNKGTPLDELQCNIVFATYSQISGEDSPKADWLLDRSEQALVIVDEAHVAAGSDSNTSRVVVDLVARAWGVVYSSATWAKSSENLHVYGRAFSETINVASLAATMRTGGEAFSEVFSSMLARDGALMRREHDLSKIEFVVQIDDKREARNQELSDRVAEILAAMTFVSGDINKLLMKLNSETVKVLKGAREARAGARFDRRRRRPVAAAADTDAQAQTVAPGMAGAAAAAVVEPATPAPPVLGTILTSHFGAGSVLYQVMRRFLAVLNADHVADLALRAIEENRKPVIVFEDTGESFVKRLIQQEILPGIEGEADVLPTAVRAPTIQDLLRHVMKRLGVVAKVVTSSERFMTPTARRELAEARDDARENEEIDIDTVAGAQDDAVRRGETMSVLELPGLTGAEQQAYKEGIERILKMIAELPPMPLNAIDIVQMRLAEAGLRVGEISGRKLRLEAPAQERLAAIDSPTWATAQWNISVRNTKKSAVNETVYAFNSGELDVVCANRSAATGLSLHASPRFDDTRRRELVEMQIPEDPTNRIQLYGRVNRYDQVCTPKISIATTGIFGEVRQLMQQNKKLARLSANIRSSRDNAAEIKSIPDLLNAVGEEVARRFLEDNGGIRSRLGISDKDLESRTLSLVQRLTSRVALLRVVEQKMVYDELYEMFDDAMLRHELAGENPLMSREMDIRAATKDQRIAIGIEMDGQGSAFDGPVYLKKIEWHEDRRPVQWPGVIALVERGRASLVQSGHAAFVEDARVEEVAPGDGAAAYEGEAPDLGEVQAELQPYAFMPSAAALVASDLLPRSGLGFAPRSLAAAVDGETMRPIRMGKMIDHLGRILEAKMRIELSGSDYPDVVAALASERPNAVKRAYARRLWVQQFMGRLVPGTVIGMENKKEKDESLRLFSREWAVITGVHPPAPGKEALLSRWKYDVLKPGDEKPRVHTLASLMEGADVTSITRDGMPAMEATGDLLVSSDLFAARGGYAMGVDRLKDEFKDVEVGRRKRSAMVLDGNMYLASEWAAATKQGGGVIYTDDKGLRHRAVMLKKGVTRGTDLMVNMPVRLWSTSMVSDFLKALMHPVEGAPEIHKNLGGQGWVVPTDFRSASARDGFGEESKGTKIGIIPGKGIAMIVERADLARTLRALRGDQKNWLRKNHPGFGAYSDEKKLEVGEDLVKITSTSKPKRGARPMIYLDCSTDEQFARAVDLMCRATGVELYIPRGTAMGDMADRAQRAYFEERRRLAAGVRATQAAAAEGGQPPAIDGEPQPAARNDAGQSSAQPDPEMAGAADQHDGQPPEGDDRRVERERIVA